MREERSGSVVLEEIIRRNEALPQMDVNFAELILTGGWYLWWERRQQVHGERTQPIARSAVSIMVLTLNYMKAMKKQPQIKDGWKKPREDYVKVNVDASFDENTGTGSTGVVIRDHTGGAIAMSQRYLPYVDDAPMAEAYGLLDGLRLAEGVGCNRVIVNSDCVEVVNTMKDDGFSATSAAAINDDCVVIWKGFSDISIDHCNRDANKVAHELVFNSFSNKSSCIWADEPPSFILATLANDVIMFDDQ
jgi:ribonuclease HI